MNDIGPGGQTAKQNNEARALGDVHFFSRKVVNMTLQSQ